MPDYRASIQYPYLEGVRPELLLTNAPSGLTRFSHQGSSYILAETTTWVPRDPANIINAEIFVSSVQDFAVLDDFWIAGERGPEIVPVTHHRRLTLESPRSDIPARDASEYHHLRYDTRPESGYIMYTGRTGMAAINAAFEACADANEIAWLRLNPDLMATSQQRPRPVDQSIVANFLPQTLTPAAKTAEELDKEDWAKNGLF